MAQEGEKLGKRKYAEYIRDFTALGNPFLLLLVSFAVLNNLPDDAPLMLWWIVLVGSFLFNEFVCSGIKFLWHKPRPNQQKYKGSLEKIDAGSFPSIHSSRIMLVYGMLSYFEYTYQQYIYLPFFALVILIVGYSRTFLHKHFWLDVFAGYTFGGLWLFLLISFVI